MSKVEWLEGNRIKVAPPTKPLKLTGTRFAAVMGLNKWSSPFKTWCEVTRTYKEPFEDTIYTVAGKVIEPKQAEYMKKSYFMTNLVTPTEVYGENYFQKTWGDFFPDITVFGGMWDYLLTDKNGNPTAVLEMKTSKRVEDWETDIPEYYALQAALYAYLLGVDQVYMVATFLDTADYEHPEDFIVNAKNTIVRPFKLSERYPRINEDYVTPALHWWQEHVETGVSPEYDEKIDADILKELRTNNVNPETDVSELVREAEQLKAEIDEVSATIADKQKRYKQVVAMIKENAVSQFRDGDKKVVVPGTAYTWEVSRSESAEIDKTALESDGLLDKYSKPEVSYRITPKLIKKEN